MNVLIKFKLPILILLLLLPLAINLLFADYEPTDRNGFRIVEGNIETCYCGPSMQCFPCYDRVEDSGSGWDKFLDFLSKISPIFELFK
ncbi:hypothetical protein JW877_01740 [bacterium]|nr:hypothetical protein [bacterium]